MFLERVRELLLGPRLTVAERVERIEWAKEALGEVFRDGRFGEYTVQEAYLFGSLAVGGGYRSSDADVAVIVGEALWGVGSGVLSARIQSALDEFDGSRECRVHILAVSRQEWQDPSIDFGGVRPEVIMEAKRDGILIYS